MKIKTGYPKHVFSLLMLCILSEFAYAQEAEVTSPNAKIEVSLLNTQEGEQGNWYLKVFYNNEGEKVEVIPQIDLGLVLDDQDFSETLRFIKADKPRSIREHYTMVHGKSHKRENEANEVRVQFKNKQSTRLNLILRAYNDGLAFSYEVPEKSKEQLVLEEKTAYTIPDSTVRWLQKFNPANEGYYRKSNYAEVQSDWAYPALFHTPDTTAWFLIHEANLMRTYAGTKLKNTDDAHKYKLVFPDDWNGRGQGERLPTINGPWQSPWRVIMVGELEDIVSSTLVEDVSEPSVIDNTDWIKPGLVSWNYWSNNHGTKDYQVVTRFADLAATMGWRYTLLDWEWDAMGNGGDLEDALDYIHDIGVTPLIWYNSGGDHNWVGATPKDRMLTHENRVAEFIKLNKLGIAGVKVDFFESEKQDMINYYLDIIEDAAEYNIMVYFHGSLVPRGWARTYPNVMTYESVRGAEWYNNVPDFTFEAPVHNTILPFTRNVVGSMDYTPVTFTNSQHPHLTSYGHELALGIVFESALQHLADRPDGYLELPDAAKVLLRNLPASWDEVKLLSGYPGKDVVIARRSQDNWYVGGINAEDREKHHQLSLSFLPKNTQYRLTLITDGDHDKKLTTEHWVVDDSEELNIRMLRRGGFSAFLEKID
ncbi:MULTISPECIES: glycoside hydrolase family 97 protein [unclassified Leeuwenhoekiella]|uniref:glycoside hydrolase family 97 protein n=1 Tax=unclassified Leeuwenhoekiella TaxID=2615029 RepID=UPI000C45745A|nr:MULTISPECIES: glycoside hydrolase family 97 protein [unclassified Leeuwenhoekiella]MAW94800.1 alpha-glucosidase [Leeuwenhoekiella sp.]MBA79520.1 alpha-glucosidase [Leeuwenhoekiella sp.]|tara:strand:+ start:124 stop:2070 length:1947 start_codon:yes stop_codon:yes gene_type:complete